MQSVLLSIAARFLLPIILLFSIFLLLRGHNRPGGGFAAGLVAGVAVGLLMFGENLKAVRRLLPCDPLSMIAAGLLVAIGSGAGGLSAGEPFMTGAWLPWELPILGGLHLGTPFLFDIGVFLVAAGTLLLSMTTLEEHRER